MSANGFETICAGNSRCSISFSDQILNVRLSGEIDQSGAGTLREKIDRAAESCLPQTLLLDFSGVSFMDSSGIALVVQSARQMRAIGGSLTVRGVSRQAMRVFDAAGIPKIVRFVGKEEKR